MIVDITGLIGDTRVVEGYLDKGNGRIFINVIIIFFQFVNIIEGPVVPESPSYEFTIKTSLDSSEFCVKVSMEFQ